MSKFHVATMFVKNSEEIVYANAKMYESVFRFSNYTAIGFYSCFLQPSFLICSCNLSSIVLQNETNSVGLLNI